MCTLELPTETIIIDKKTIQISYIATEFELIKCPNSECQRSFLIPKNIEIFSKDKHAEEVDEKIKRLILKKELKNYSCLNCGEIGKSWALFLKKLRKK